MTTVALLPGHSVITKIHHRLPAAHAVHLQKTQDDTKFNVTIQTRRRPGHDLIPKFEDYLNCSPRPRLSPDEFARRYGSSPEDLANLTNHYSQFGLQVETHAARRHVYLTGTAEQFNAAFGVELHDYEKQHGRDLMRFRSHASPLQVPNHLEELILNVEDVGNEPLALPGAAFLDFLDNNVPPPTAGLPPVTTNLTSQQLASIYGFPVGYSGSGQTIAIPIFPGWGQYVLSDVALGCNHQGVAVPNITQIFLQNIDIGTSGENTVDIQMCAYFAPGANLVVYVTGSVDQLVARVANPAPGEAACSIISMSFAATELIFSGNDTALEDAAIQGITMLASSGDWGTTDGVGNRVACYPATSPWVIGVGGTSVGANSGTPSLANIVEWAWNQGIYYYVTGGGVSVMTPLPSFQSGFGVPASIYSGGTLNGAQGRGEPDLACNAAPNCGPIIFVGGVNVGGGGGTSASCPIMAGMFACINHALGRNLGYLLPTMYAASSSIFRKMSAGGPTDNSFTDNTSSNPFPGSYAGYPVTTGWSANVGLGVIYAQSFISYIRTVSPPNLGLAQPLLSNFSVPVGSPIGTLIGTYSVQVTGGTFTGTLTLLDSPNFQLVGNRLLTAVSLAAGSYPLTCVANMIGVAGSPSSVHNTIVVFSQQTGPSVTQVSLSNSTVAGSLPSGTVIGTITVSLSSGAFTGSLSLSGGNAASFQIISGKLCAQGTTVQGSYSLNIVATQTGVANSPFIQAITVTVTAAAPKITGVTLSNNSVSFNPPSGTVVGNIGVNISSGSFTGTLSLGGTGASHFQIVGNSGTTLTTTTGSITDDTGNVWSLFNDPNNGIEVLENGTPAGFSANVILLLFFNGVIYQENNALGWWSWTNNDWLEISGDPRVGTAGPTTLSTLGTVPVGTYNINIIATQAGATGSPFTQAATVFVNAALITITGINLSATTVAAGSPSGTVVGAVVVALSAGSFTGTLSLTGVNASQFQIIGSSLSTLGVVPSGTYSLNIIATQSGAGGSPFTQAVTVTATGPAITITGIILSNLSVPTTTPSGGPVGHISVSTSNGSFTGTLSLSGAGASMFQIIGSNLCTLGTLTAGNYSLNIVATQTGVTGSPFTQAETITMTSSSVTAITFSNPNPTYDVSPIAGTVITSITVTIS